LPKSNSSLREGTETPKETVGVLALQGDVVEHLAAFERLGVTAVPVKSKHDLDGVDRLVIPGGESTTVIRLLDRFDLERPIVQRVHEGMPLWGTCMGLIIAADRVADLDQKTLGLLDVTVRRNAFGRQVDSTEMELSIPALGAAPFKTIFIRAPWIERAGTGVEVLAERDGHPVFVRQENVMGTSFHPELGVDPRVHEYFLREVGRAARAA